ncbi:MAG: hypothetical protein KDD58_14945 [Bdellovibrionales bacterium]|nr:hypothetical protein [Bdellovibrionales bacterium]
MKYLFKITKMKQLIILVTILISVLIFQNCSDGFQAFKINEGTADYLSETNGNSSAGPKIDILSQPVPELKGSSTIISFITSSQNEEIIVSTQCSLNKQAFEKCESPLVLNNLKSGDYTLEIKVTTDSGQTTIVNLEWIVNLTSSLVAISSAPSQESNSKTAAFSFEVSNSGISIETIECRLDNGPLEKCSSPKIYSDLSIGDHTFEILVTDIDKNITSEKYTWKIKSTSNQNTQQPLLFDPIAMALNATTTHAYVLDERSKSIIKVELASGFRQLIFDGGVSSDFKEVSDMAVNINSNQAFVTDYGHKAIFQIDLITGQKTLVSSANRGNGPSLIKPTVLTIKGNQAFVVDSNTNQLLQVDLVTGNRSIISQVGGEGSDFKLAKDIVVKQDLSEAFVISGGIDTFGIPYGNLVSIDLRSGLRSFVMIDGDKQFPNSPTPNIGEEKLNYSKLTAIALIKDETKAILVGEDSVAELDFKEKVYKVISSITGRTGNGESFRKLKDISIDFNAGQVFMVDSIKDGIFRVDLSTGDRTLFSSSNLGIGIGLLPRDSIYDELGNRTLSLYKTFDSSIIGIAELSIQTGDRKIVSSNDIGNGTKFDLPIRVSNNKDYSKIYFIDNGRLLVVDLKSGERRTISDRPSVLSHPSIDGKTHGLVVNSSESQAYALNTSRDSLIRIDILTGFRTTVSPTVEDNQDLSFSDSEIYNLYLTDNDSKAIVAKYSLGTAYVVSVDLVTGMRQLIAKFEVGVLENKIYDNSLGFTINKTATWGYLYDLNTRSLLKVDLKTNQREVLSGLQKGNGIMFDKSNYIVKVNSAESKAIFLNTSEMIEVDLATGNRTIKSKWVRPY